MNEQRRGTMVRHFHAFVRTYSVFGPWDVPAWQQCLGILGPAGVVFACVVGALGWTDASDGGVWIMWTFFSVATVPVVWAPLQYLDIAISKRRPEHRPS